MWRLFEKYVKSQRRSSGSQARQFSYDWLNRTVFPQILAEGKGRFRPQYAWGVLQGVNLANALGKKRVSVIEFGVAGGNGLVALERVAEKVEAIYDVGVDVYGFDTGVGLPRPQAYHDLPNIYTEGRHPMDVNALRRCLRKAQLVIGVVKETVIDFVQSNPAPVAFIAIDLDYYSSTMHSFQLLDAQQDLLLPRIHCYCDDIMGLTFGDHNGERLAIVEFNASHDTRKISPIYGLKYFLPAPFANQLWLESFFMAHIFDHAQYACFDGLAPLYDTSLARE